MAGIWAKLEKIDRFFTEDAPVQPPVVAPGTTAINAGGANILRNAAQTVAEKDEVSTGAAILRLVAAQLFINGGIGDMIKRAFGNEKVDNSKVLTKITNFEIDDLQNALLDKIRKLYKIAGFKETIIIPTTQNIETVVRDLQRDFSRIVGNTGVIENRTQQLVKSWHSGILDNDDPTLEERNIAAALIGLSPLSSPEQLRRTLNDFIVQRAQDISSNLVDAEQGQRYLRAKAQLDELKSRNHNEWFILDWLSSIVLLTEHQRKKLETQLWSIDAKGIHFISIGEDDRLDVNWLDINIPTLDGSGGEWLLEINHTTSADQIRKIGGRLLRMPMEEISQVLGGTLQFEAQGSDKRRELFVRNVEHLKKLMVDLAISATKCEQAVERMNVQRKEQNTSNLSPIRPNVVASLLPDPTILLHPTNYTKRGTNIHRNVNEEIRQLLDGMSLPAALSQYQQLSSKASQATADLQLADQIIARESSNASSTFLMRSEIRKIEYLLDGLEKGNIQSNDRVHLLALIRKLQQNSQQLSGEESVLLARFNRITLRDQVIEFEKNARELRAKIDTAQQRAKLLPATT